MSETPEPARIEHVTKLDAARRQLTTAVRLFFSGGDMVSAHTLAAASHEVLCILAKGNGEKSIVRNTEWIKPDLVKEFHDLLNKPQNFFKHANRDPEAVLEFSLDATPVWIYDAICIHEKLGDAIPREFSAFKLWFTMEYSHWLVKTDAFANALQDLKRNGVTKESIWKMIE